MTEEPMQAKADQWWDGNGIDVDELKFIAGYMELTGAPFNEARNIYIFLESRPLQPGGYARASDCRNRNRVKIYQHDQGGWLQAGRCSLRHAYRREEESPEQVFQ